MKTYIERVLEMSLTLYCFCDCAGKSVVDCLQAFYLKILFEKS